MIPLKDLVFSVWRDTKGAVPYNCAGKSIEDGLKQTQIAANIAGAGLADGGARGEGGADKRATGRHHG